ncbi:Cuticle protein 14 isoform a [Halotydeus destructor]|nr:Cuticle protein 14 isoform a [Halotydeus destructor]
MKCMLIVAFLGSAAYANIVANTGSSSQFRTQDNSGNYAFGYNEDHATGGTFRRESGNAAGQVVGSYGLRDIDGRIRTVNYVADDAGYRANIVSNEPGVEPKDPASATINKAGPVVAAPIAVAASAPIIAQAPLYAQAPVAVAAPAPLYAPAPVAVAPVATSYTTTTQHVAPARYIAAAPAAPLIAAAPLAAAYAAPAYAAPAYAAPLAARIAAPALAAPLVNQYALNTYAHPAAWGYTLGLPQTFGYTVYKKK